MSDYIRYRTRGKWTSERDANNKRINVQQQDGYKGIAEQLDLLWHDIDNGKLGADAKTGGFYTTIKALKDKYPKPS